MTDRKLLVLQIDTDETPEEAMLRIESAFVVCNMVAKLNPDAATIGHGMLAELVRLARIVTPLEPIAKVH